MEEKKLTVTFVNVGYGEAILLECPDSSIYVDFPLLKSIAETCGLHGELVAEGEHYDYLARIF